MDASSSSRPKLQRPAEYQTRMSPSAFSSPSGNSGFVLPSPYNLRTEHQRKEVVNTNFETRFSMHVFLKQVQKLNSKQRAAIERVGFGSLLRLTSFRVSKVLIGYVIGKWSSQKRAFQIGDGEFSMTPLEVALIMGLRITGKAVTIREDEPLSDLEKHYMGTPKKRKISVTTLERRLDRLARVDDEPDFVRSFLLFAFGTILFPNSGGTVSSRYISFLEDLDGINEFAWGLAVLENLLMCITARKDEGVRYVGGCLLLLQIWSYEHFDVARPNLRVNCLTFPRACRWEDTIEMRSKVIGKFEELEENQIIWKLQPTDSELKVDVIREFLMAQMDEPHGTGLQSEMANLSMDNDINAELDSVIDQMEKTHIFDASKGCSSATDYPSHREESDLLPTNWTSGETVTELRKKSVQMSWNPVGKF